MAHVCPWWGGYFIDNSLRRWVHNPDHILRSLVTPGMRALDFGCGMGLYAIGMARLVGPEGRVMAVDLQPQMLQALERRAAQAGVGDRIETHCCSDNSLDLEDSFDFALASYSAHEVPDVTRLLNEIYRLLRHQGSFLLIEPKFHVTRTRFAAMLEQAAQIGFGTEKAPPVRLSHAALLTR